MWLLKNLSETSSACATHHSSDNLEPDIEGLVASQIMAESFESAVHAPRPHYQPKTAGYATMMYFLQGHTADKPEVQALWYWCGGPGKIQPREQQNLDCLVFTDIATCQKATEITNSNIWRDLLSFHASYSLLSNQTNDVLWSLELSSEPACPACRVLDDIFLLVSTCHPPCCWRKVEHDNPLKMKFLC